MDKDYFGILFDIVYRNFYLFKDLGIIESIELDGEMKFRIVCINYYYYYFICENCGEIKVIDFCLIEKIKS